MSVARYAAVLGAVATTAFAHGTVSGIVADGVYAQGYSPNMQYDNPIPVVVGWSIPQDLSNGFVSDPTSTDAICHIAATPAGKSATVAAGGKVAFEWTPWPSSHKGPVMTYLAPCNGDCSTVDKTTLKFFKIDAVGLVSPTGATNGEWASDEMIANNNTWTSTIPATLKAGNYVARHETIALHSAGSVGGAQMYPFCVNLQVTGGGSDLPDGVVGTALYTAQSLVFNLYTTLTTYAIPGPAVPAVFANDQPASQNGDGTASGSAPAPSSAATVASASTSAPATPASTASSSSSSAVIAAASPSVTTTPMAANGGSLTKTQTMYTTDYTTDMVTSTSVAVTDIAAPTQTAAASGTAASMGSTKALPAGTTINDLLAWLKIILNQQSTKKRAVRLELRDVLAMVL